MRRATHRRGGSHRAPRRRGAGGVASLAVLATATAVAVPVASLGRGGPDTEEAGGSTAAVARSSAPASPLALAADRPEGEVAVGRDPDPGQSQPPRPATRIPEWGPGTFEIAGAPPAGSAAGLTYRVEVERGLPFSTQDVARFVEATLTDKRGWAAQHQFVLVDGHADLRIVLATPETTDDLCAPLETDGRLSCRNGDDVVLNAWRWQFGADGYAGDLEAYRRYVVNHETGHALGYPHVGCPGPGEIAPVMLQQTKGLEGCKPNPWPARVDLAGH